MDKSSSPVLLALENLIHWETYTLIALFVLTALGLFKLFRRRLTEERQRNLQGRFANLYKQFLILTALFLLFTVLDPFKSQKLVLRVLPYIGLVAVMVGSITFIQICRILLLQYLFLTSVRTAVPILMVNIFTLALSLFLIGWVITTVFGIQVGPLLATSAAFSIILGLALQDTLGNLFAGIALQIDHNFEIGDWLEVTFGLQKFSGQVLEITWRSTVLVGLFDEVINVPNRFMAQSQINNWTRSDIPIARSQAFRIPYTENLEHVTQVLNKALSEVMSIRKLPRPTSLVSEPADSWVVVKVVYYIDDYGRYASAADEVLRRCIKALKDERIAIAHPLLELTSPKLESEN